MPVERDIWAVLPIKDFTQAKQRLSSLYPPDIRRGLAKAMASDVLAALAAVPTLDGILVVTDDAEAASLAKSFGCVVSALDARGGHTVAVGGAARFLSGKRASGMLVVPGDVPLATSEEIAALLQAHRGSQGFTIAPARDEKGSNGIVCSPPDRMPLTYGDNSYLPHLATARAYGMEPIVCRLPGIGLDIDHPEDLALFMTRPSATRTWAFLVEHRLTGGGTARLAARALA